VAPTEDEVFLIAEAPKKWETSRSATEGRKCARTRATRTRTTEQGRVDTAHRAGVQKGTRIQTAATTIETLTMVVGGDDGGGDSDDGDGEALKKRKICGGRRGGNGSG